MSGLVTTAGSDGPVSHDGALPHGGSVAHEGPVPHDGSVASAASATTRVVVDLAAIRHNVRVLAATAPGAEVMAVVKADAYGHGRLPVARAALEAGATWLGVAQVTEALALRAELDRAGPGGAPGTAPAILAWLFAPGADLARAVAAGIDLGVGAPWALAEAAAAGRASGKPARLHLKVDTGMGRGGSLPRDWVELVSMAAGAQAAGDVEVVAVWSHLACADEPDDPATARQARLLDEAVEAARAAGLHPLVHLAASAGTLWHPGTHHDLVRVGIAMYGISPNPAVASAGELGLRPALRWEADLTLVKRLDAGTPISYGATETLTEDTWVGVVPVGYSDGVPRHASSSGPVRVGGHRGRVRGRVCMDQIVVDVGRAGPGDAAPAAAGDAAVLIGPDGPTAEDWAQAAGTIGYEIVTRVGERVPRRYVDEPALLHTGARTEDERKGSGPR